MANARGLKKQARQVKQLARKHVAHASRLMKKEARLHAKAKRVATK